jgi:tRNA splicing ligase
MNLTKLSKTELLMKCEENGIKKCKSKNKEELIALLENKPVEKKVKQKLQYAKKNWPTNVAKYNEQEKQHRQKHIHQYLRVVHFFQLD